jgi:hypothetical protein
MDLIMGLLEGFGGTQGHPAGKMIQGQGMGLKRGVPIGLGEVPGIAGFGGEAQVGKAQVSGYFRLLPEQRQFGSRRQMRLDEKSHQEQNAAADKNQEAVGFSQGHNSIIRDYAAAW